MKTRTRTTIAQRQENKWAKLDSPKTIQVWPSGRSYTYQGDYNAPNGHRVEVLPEASI